MSIKLLQFDSVASCQPAQNNGKKRKALFRAALSVLAVSSVFTSVPAAAACVGTTLSMAFLEPGASFVAYTNEAKTIRLEPCGVWWTTAYSVSFSSGEASLPLYDDGRHKDGGDNDKIYGNTWLPTKAGPVTLTVTTTNPYNANEVVTATVSGTVLPRYYSIESVPFQWVDATTGTKQPMGTAIPQTTGAIPIGFDFKFYGTSFNSLSATSQGALTLGRLWGGPYYYNTFLPDPAEPNNLIAPFWDGRLYGGNLYTKLTGTAPNRQFTISWIDTGYGEQCNDVCYPSGTASFQVTLYEGSNDIVFRYLDVDFDLDMGKFYTVGVENSDGTQAALHYAYNEFAPGAGVSSLSALRFSVYKAVAVAPTLASFSPGTGSPDTVVTVNGTNFDTGAGLTTVSLNGVNVPLVQVSSSDLLFFIVPSGATSGKITVTTPGGSATSTTNFTVVPPCTSQYPVTTVQSLGDGTGTINAEVKASFTGNITNAAAIKATPSTNTVYVCANTTASYAATTSKGTLACKLNGAAAGNSGTLRINDKLECSNRTSSGVRDTDVFYVKQQP